MSGPESEEYQNPQFPLNLELERPVSRFSFDPEPEKPINEKNKEKARSHRIILEGAYSNYFQNAVVLLENNEHELARNLLYRVLQKYPMHEPSIKFLAKSYRASENYSKAEQLFSKLFDLNPNYENQFLLASVEYEMERDRAAKKSYLKCIEIMEDEPEFNFEIFKNLGNISLREGDIDSAEEYYNKAYAIFPNSDTLLVNYGTLEMQRSDFDVALERFREAVRINPENDRGWVGLALIHREYGDFQLAWANVKASLDANPMNRTSIGLALEWGVSDQRSNEVMDLVKAYLESNDDDFEVSLALAKVFFIERHLDECAIELERCLSFDPMNEEAYELKELLHQQTNKVEGED